MGSLLRGLRRRSQSLRGLLQQGQDLAVSGFEPASLDRELDWFVVDGGAYRTLTPDAGGILRSQVFPGLWLKPQTMVDADLATVLELLRDGLQSDAHRDFLDRLASARKLRTD